ncbi:MAG: hypothetical protein OEW98_00200 [Betaproteobacteria bacterium]|nr:hypothetical protein [Betaproteobacteria bacterium]
MGTTFVLVLVAVVAGRWWLRVERRRADHRAVIARLHAVSAQANRRVVAPTDREAA